MSPGGRPAKPGERTPVRLTEQQRSTILRAAAVEGINNLSDAAAIFATRAAEAVLAAAGPADLAAVADLATRGPGRRAARPAPALDPFEAYGQGGVEELRRQLDGLDVTQLQDLIRHFG